MSFRKSASLLPLALLLAVTTTPLTAQAASTDVAQGLWERDHLTGDWGGLRSKLEDKGITLSATETLESFGNYSGGMKRGQLLEGQLNVGLDADFEKLAGIHGLTAHVNALQIHGNGISTSHLGGNMMTVSSIEGERNTRLFTLWAQQNLFDDNLSIRLGQLAADEEFIVSDYAGLYINSEYGWPNMMATNLPSGGPGYPLTTPGVRIKVGQTNPWSWQLGIFDGDPAAHGYGATSQQKNSSGTNFNMDRGALIMSEVAYGRHEVTLPSTYKFGLWYHTENFEDKRDTSIKHQGDYGLYAVVDQKLWNDHANKDNGIGAFARLSLAPADRNTAEWQADAGINWKGVFKGRDNDTLGLAASYIGIGEQSRDADRDSNITNSTSAPVRDYEANLELTYQAQITPWMTLQPDLQYIFHPGANIANPNDASGTTAIKDAFIGGVRLKVNF